MLILVVRFVPEGLLLVPQVTELPKAWTLLLLCVASAATIGVCAVVVGYIRDRFDALLERQAMETWNLQQLVPPEVIGSDEETVSTQGPSAD